MRAECALSDLIWFELFCERGKKIVSSYEICNLNLYALAPRFDLRSLVCVCLCAHERTSVHITRELHVYCSHLALDITFYPFEKKCKWFEQFIIECVCVCVYHIWCVFWHWQCARISMLYSKRANRTCCTKQNKKTTQYLYK